MLKGETRTLRHTETATTAFILAGSGDAPSVVITEPDDTLLDPALTPTVSPVVGNSALSHTFSADLPIAFKGRFKVDWKFKTGNQVRHRIEYYFATQENDLITWIRDDLLRKSVIDLPDRYIHSDLVLMSKRLEANYITCLASGYVGLSSTSDIFNFERGLGYLVAARMREFNPEKYKTGGLIQSTQGPVTYKYQPAIEKIRGSVEDIFLRESVAFLNAIACVKAEIDTFNNDVEFFALAGPRRGLKNTISCGLNELYIIANAEMVY